MITRMHGYTRLDRIMNVIIIKEKIRVTPIENKIILLVTPRDEI